MIEFCFEVLLCICLVVVPIWLLVRNAIRRR